MDWRSGVSCARARRPRPAMTAHAPSAAPPCAVSPSAATQTSRTDETVLCGLRCDLWTIPPELGPTPGMGRGHRIHGPWPLQPGLAVSLLNVPKKGFVVKDC
jgi:hypothetical protein